MPTAPGDAPASPDGARIRSLDLILLAAQVGLVVLLIRQFRIESETVGQVSIYCLAGFIVHAVLPLPLRLPFFVLLGGVALVHVLGPAGGAWTVGLVLSLVGLCHLPVSSAIRVGLVTATGLALAACRAGWIVAPWPDAIWPVLGSMLMFRLILYLYDLRHDRGLRLSWSTLAYFVMLPNVCFALFPVIDFKTFRRTYYDGEARHIYQAGVHWMVRGALQLLAYRFVYHYGMLAPSEVRTGVDLVQFLVANFALYLRVSGSFHLIVGMLHLFGFHLPPTHHLYFLASSVGDFWRRINIYWKDFMQKLFFLPAFFALRGRGAGAALGASTLLVFVMTWLLHSYQWFWFSGFFPLTWQDATFWGVLGVVMVVQNLWFDAARGQVARPQTMRATASGVLRVAVTFAFLCVLWSLWTAESFDEWTALWSVAGTLPRSRTPLLIAAGVGAVASVATALAVRSSTGLVPAASGGMRPMVLTSLVLVGLSAATLPEVSLRFGRTGAAIVQALRNPDLNRVESEKLHRGYYEDLFHATRIDSPLARTEALKPNDWRPLFLTSVARETDDLLGFELVPSSRMVFLRTALHVNRWGMRDRDYAREKAAGTYRIAIVGDSLVMGSGVGDEETFENRLEDRLNQTHSDRRFEILNFAVGGYSALQQMVTVERKVLDFAPDVLFYVANGAEPGRVIDYLVKSFQRGVMPADPFLVQLLSDTGVTADMPVSTAAKLLGSSKLRLLDWVYGRVAARCRERGVRPVWVFVPFWEEDSMAALHGMARNAGFVVVDLSGLYDGRNRAALDVAPWDTHPNAVGHQLIADHLFAAIEERPDLLQPGVRPRPASKRTILWMDQLPATGESNGDDG